MSVLLKRANIPSSVRGVSAAAVALLTLATLTPAAVGRTLLSPAWQEPSEIRKLWLRRHRGGRAQPKTSDKPPKTREKTPSGTGTAGRGRGRRGVRGPGQAAPDARSAQGYAVTIIANDPGVDVLVLNARGRSILRGKTGADLKFTTRIARGNYVINLSRDGRAPYIRQQVSVQHDNTTFNINFPPRPTPRDIAVAAPSPTPVPTPTPAPTPPPVVPEAVIDKFLDPEESEGVTASDWQQVLSQTNEALARAPNDERLKARAFFAIGQIEYLRGNYDGSLPSFRQAASLSPNGPGQWLAAYGLGNAYLAGKRAGEAAAEYRRAVEAKPDFALAYKRLGDALSKTRDSAGASAAYARAKELGYVPPELTFNKAHQEARILMKSDRSKALRSFQALRELTGVSQVGNTFQADMLTDMGDCYAELKQAGNAKDSYRRATELDPENARAHYRYGEALFKEHAYADAAKMLDRAVRLFIQGNQPGDRNDMKRAVDMKEKADRKLAKAK